MHQDVLEVLDKAVEVLRAEYKSLHKERLDAFARGDFKKVDSLESVIDSVKTAYWNIEQLQERVAPHLYIE